MFDDLKEKLAKLRMLKIAIIGDFCIDRYFHCSRVAKKYDYSELATCDVDRESHAPGGAGNVVCNFLSLGATVFCVGVLGDDGDAYDLKRSLNQLGANAGETGANTENLFLEAERKTVCCVRPVFDGRSLLNIHEFMCLNDSPLTNESLRKIESALLNLAEKVDAIVAVEQFERRGNGVLHPKIKLLLAEIARQYPTKIVIADSRDYLHEYENILLKCNRDELASMGKTVEIGEVLSKNKALFLTKGELGMSILSKNAPIDVPTEPIFGEIYTCGAGDSATAGIVAGLYLGYDYTESAILGNLVASITIQKLGSTDAATVGEILRKIDAGFEKVLVNTGFATV